MNEQADFSVWDALSDFGFTPDSEVMSDLMPGLSLDFGNFKLTASAVISKYFRGVVLLGGVFATKRTLKEVHFEIPRMVDSREQLTAYLAYYLDNAAGSEGFYPERPVEWVSEGRTHRMLLPWEVERAAYDVRPCCMAPRDWMRQALNCLKEIVENAEDVAPVDFSFDGKVLMIICCGQVLPVPADGQPWPVEFTVPAGNLRHLPKRLMRHNVEVSVYEEKLLIGNRRFQGVMEKTP